jgi:hypothetical protein
VWHHCVCVRERARVSLRWPAKWWWVHRRYCSSHSHPLNPLARVMDRSIHRSITTVVCVGPNTHTHTHTCPMYIAVVVVVVVVAAAHGCSVVPLYILLSKRNPPSHTISGHNNIARHTTHTAHTLSTLATLVVTVGIYIYSMDIRTAAVDTPLTTHYSFLDIYRGDCGTFVSPIYGWIQGDIDVWLTHRHTLQLVGSYTVRYGVNVGEPTRTPTHHPPRRPLYTRVVATVVGVFQPMFGTVVRRRRYCWWCLLVLPFQSSCSFVCSFIRSSWLASDPTHRTFPFHPRSIQCVPCCVGCLIVGCCGPNSFGWWLCCCCCGCPKFHPPSLGAVGHVPHGIRVGFLPAVGTVRFVE